MVDARWRVVLLGSDYEDLDTLQVVSPAAHVAVAVSAGRHPKGYRYCEVNEDALVAAGDHRAELLAVADGHGGIAAARAAVEGIAAGTDEILAAALHGSDGVVQAVSLAFERAALAIREAEVGLQAATTLSVWVVAGARASAATKGDSVAVQIGRRARVTMPSPGFLGADSSIPGRPRRRRVVPGGWLLALTDGVVDFLPRPWTRAIAEMAAAAADPVQLATLLVEESFRGGSGDNASVVVRRSPTDAVGAVGAP